MAIAGVKRENKKPKKRARKVNLVFDEVKRRDFLTGFRKRKLQRKKHAQEKLENDLKEERKRLKSDAKESYKKLVVSHRDIPELEKYLSNEYEEDDVTVKVVELSTNEIAKQSNWIGANQPKYESDQEEEEEPEPEDPEEIIGMELKAKTPKATKGTTKPTTTKQFHSEKQVKKELKKQATKNMQKSKVFQKKNKMEQRKQKKQSLRANRLKEGAKQKFGKKGSKKGRFNKRNKDTD